MSIRDQIPEIEQRWYAVRCKFRCEKKLMTEFNEQGIETYVPIQRKNRQYSSRIKKSAVALIPSHIFVRINRTEYIPILQHHHVFQFLNFSGVLQAIPDEEMQIMRRVVGEDHHIVVQDSTYSKGDQVQIIGGELTGLSGTLIEGGESNLKIKLTSLGMGLIIHVNPAYLIKVGSREAMTA